MEDGLIVVRTEIVHVHRTIEVRIVRRGDAVLARDERVMGEKKETVSVIERAIG